VTNQESGLALAEVTIPEMLTGYDSTCAGKWHLHGNLGNLHPNDTGFGYYAGTLRGALPDYSAWPKVTNGQMSQSTTYATTDTAEEAIAALHRMQEPWFLYVSFNAIHTPFHEPDSSVCGRAVCPDTWCNNLPANPTAVDLAKAMTESMDAAMGRILTELDVVDPDAYVVFMGDNGTPRSASEDPFTAAHAKGSLYEGGVNVPLIVRGPGVAAVECAGLVAGVDLFATFAELAHVRATADDSVSMVPYFADPSVSLRETVYAETFSPNGGPPTDHRRAIRDERYKLIRQTGEPDEFYDLDNDGFETADLLPNLNGTQQAAHDALVAELVALGVD
jgi:arylsulfatase A-like enzyme